MPTVESEAARRSIRAPSESGERLLAPPVSQWDALWQNNLAVQEASDHPLLSRREQARAELVSSALAFTSQYRDPSPRPWTSRRIVLTGHQPELFHPGVWFKNFVLSQLSERFAASPIQLIIDNDLFRQSAIRVPTGSLDAPRLTHVRFSQNERIVPYEIATVADDESFHAFGERVHGAIQSLIPDPMVRRFWPHVIQQYRRTRNIGLAISATRHIVEADNGLESLELPLSRLCASASFRQFASLILEQLPEFAGVYNQSLAEFREKRRMRSQSHPVPDLDRDGDARESPFWVWSRQAPVRRRLYVLFQGNRVTLSDRASWNHELSCANLADGLGELESSGVFIRPRALITTMYARLMLSDLFLHGIGGALYDEVTDNIMRRFFHVEPDQFLTVTATMHLPLDSPNPAPGEVVQTEQVLRAMKYHPERFVDPNPENQDLMDQKRTWIRRNGPGDDLKQRHDAIGEINRRLASQLTNQFDRLAESRRRLVFDLERAAVLRSREYSFVLFPESLGAQLFQMAKIDR